MENSTKVHDRKGLSGTVAKDKQGTRVEKDMSVAGSSAHTETADILSSRRTGIDRCADHSLPRKQDIATP